MLPLGLIYWHFFLLLSLLILMDQCSFFLLHLHIENNLFVFPLSYAMFR